MPTTQWSLIERLKSPDPGLARTALDVLCRAYHYPLYCQIRRHGFSHHDAEDLLHDFLAKLLRNDSFGLAESEKGRLRTYLRTALSRFLATRHERQQRVSRHEISIESLADLSAVEGRFELDESAHHESPDILFDRQWGVELMNQVMQRLRKQYEDKGNAALFSALQPVLFSGGSLVDHDSAALCSGLGMKPGALRAALLRLLQKYREALRHEVLQTVSHQDQAPSEFAFLMACFRQD